MTELSALNVRITGDAGDLKAAVSSATGELNKVAAAAGKANTASAGLSAGLADTATAAGGGSHALRGLTQQLSQVGQQTMATGNFVQALAIELPDMGLAFGTVGTAAGLLAGIALPMVISALSDTGGQADAMKASLDNLSDATDAYRASLDAIKTPSQEMIATYGSMSAAARDFAAAMAEISRVSAFDAITASINELTEPLLGLVRYGDDFSESWFRLADRLQVSQEQAAILASALQYLAEVEGPQAQAVAAQALADKLMAAAGSYENMNAAARLVYDSAVQIGMQASEIAGSTEEAGTAAERLTQKMADAYGLYAMTRGMATELANETGRAAQNAAAMAQQQIAARGMVYGRSGARGDPRTANQQGYGQFTYTGPTLDAFNNPVVAGGGGAAVNPIQGQLEALQQSLMTQEQLEMESFARRQEMLNQALQQRLLSQEEHARLMEQVEKTHQFAMTKATNDGVQTTLGHLSQLFQGSKKIGAAIALANSWVAFTEVLKDPAYIGRPWARIAAAGAALSSGLNAVRNIKSAQPGSAGGGGAGGAGMAGGAAAAAPQTSNISLQLVGGDLFSRDQVLRLINSINEATADGARITLR